VLRCLFTFFKCFIFRCQFYGLFAGIFAAGSKLGGCRWIWRGSCSRCCACTEPGDMSSQIGIGKFMGVGDMIDGAGWFNESIKHLYQSWGIKSLPDLEKKFTHFPHCFLEFCISSNRMILISFLEHFHKALNHLKPLPEGEWTRTW